MKAYLDLVKNVLENGVRKENRTGTDTISNFAEFYKVDLSEGFPLLTTKKVFFRSVILELLWYLRGEDHIRWLRDENDCHIWDAWADEDGHVGPIYPVLWRRFPYLEKENVNLEGTGGAVESETWVRKEFDQVQRAIDMLKTNPNSRRIVVSTWHPGLLGEMALPPCHIMYIFNVSNGKLNCHLTQRSGDIALGIPFNLACYSALTMAIAQEVGLEPGTFAHTIVDAHIYVNHVDGLKEQLKREPRELPTLEIAKKPVDELTFDDFKLHNYDPDPVIKFEVAV
ncbi:MAG: thymidylate synthase [Balneola sp.]|jgi:thymidylate synthase|nr:thymidylate synthase [Balneola sp.]MBO6651289.1 thymidylate synthase [Balneola sp.]MBO6710835.1 thymidylate synthase [Balneola sp.]MBO6799522.1 thymidylate synthase [Balneola sp.]MBO6870254.1 thymidylate synthase [Balneola sp.]|tara:strand:+ start:1610 stop:2458 length:849 start_codon:yes stop_codon:yes gene_type:complete